MAKVSYNHHNARRGTTAKSFSRIRRNDCSPPTSFSGCTYGYFADSECCLGEMEAEPLRNYCS